MTRVVLSQQDSVGKTNTDVSRAPWGAPPGISWGPSGTLALPPENETDTHRAHLGHPITNSGDPLRGAPDGPSKHHNKPTVGALGAPLRVNQDETCPISSWEHPETKAETSQGTPLGGAEKPQELKEYRGLDPKPLTTHR